MDHGVAPHARQQARWHAFPDVDALLQEAVSRIAAAAERAIRAHGAFLVVLAGGETPRDAYRLLSEISTDWPRWYVYFGDERCLPPDDPARNSRMAGEALLDHVPVPRSQLHRIPAEQGARVAAAAYADSLRGVGIFDMVLLGLGQDGHTASLFPGSDWGTAPDAPDVLAVFDAPKPPPERVSLGAARLGRSREVLFLVAGAAKRAALQRWRGGEAIPAAAIAPAAGVDVLVEQALLSG